MMRCLESLCSERTVMHGSQTILPMTTGGTVLFSRLCKYLRRLAADHFPRARIPLVPKGAPSLTGSVQVYRERDARRARTLACRR